MTTNLRLTAAVLILLTLGRAGSAGGEQASADKVFQKRLYEAIAGEWRPRLQAHANELDVGIVHVPLTLTRGGKITDLRVVSNTSNQRFAELSLDSVKHTKLPAPPPDLVEHGRFKTDLIFNIYPK
jgi:outer membrane biosynthesis protein TonB